MGLDSTHGCKYTNGNHNLYAFLLVWVIFEMIIYIMAKHQVIDRCIFNNDGHCFCLICLSLWLLQIKLVFAIDEL